MDVSMFADLLTAIFTGVTAAIAVWNRAMKKLVCLYYRTPPFDRSNSVIDHQYIIEVVNNSETIIHVREVTVPKVKNPNIQFETMILAKGTSATCRVAFYEQDDFAISFRPILVRVNKENLPIYRIEVRQYKSRIKRAYMRIMELREKIL